MTYTAKEKPTRGKPIKVIARDELGKMVGEYVGYYNEYRGVITLYPAKKTLKYYGVLLKHEISDRHLRVV